MAYEAQCEARALAIEKEEERFKTIDEANDELCQHIEKMSIHRKKFKIFSIANLKNPISFNRFNNLKRLYI